jgi:predicted LPLAT superfamily acyltransferase
VTDVSRDQPRRGDTPENHRKVIGSRLGMKILVFFIRLLPARIAYCFALFPVIFYFLARADARRASYQFYEKLGLKGGRISRLAFAFKQIHMFAVIIMDNVYLGFFGNDKFAIHEHGTDLFLRMLEKGRGLLLLSAHVGNWHLAVNFLDNTNTHVHLVIDDIRSDAVRKEMDTAKGRSTHLTLHSADRGPDLAFELTAALRRNEVVIIAGDRSKGNGRRQQARFLGEPAWFPTAPLLLASAAGAPVCTALTFRVGMHAYDCFGIGPFEAPSECATREKASHMVNAFAETLEAHIRRYPTQWFNFYDFWKRS